MSEWEPATEAEVAMRDALRANDQEQYFRILARTDVLLPIAPDSSPGSDGGWGTWTTEGRTHVLAFTSQSALQECLAGHPGTNRRVPFRDLAGIWPNVEWWLAVNPGLPIEGYLPSWFVTQISRGDVRLPGRTLGARARMEQASQRTRATAQVPVRGVPNQPAPTPIERQRMKADQPPVPPVPPRREVPMPDVAPPGAFLPTRADRPINFERSAGRPFTPPPAAPARPTPPPPVRPAPPPAAPARPVLPPVDNGPTSPAPTSGAGSIRGRAAFPGAASRGLFDDADRKSLDVPGERELFSGLDRAASAPPVSGPGFGSPASAPPGFASPVSSPPGFGSPASAPPASGPSAYGSPAYGSPASAPPASAPPTYGSPASAPPASAPPASAPPASGPSAFGSPASAQPVSGAPGFGAPGNGAPGNGASGNGSPAYGSPGYGAPGPSPHGAPSERPPSGLPGRPTGRPSRTLSEGLPQRPGADPGLPPRPGVDPGFPPRPGSGSDLPSRPAADPGFAPRTGTEPGFAPRTGTEPGFAPRPGAASGFAPRPGAEPGLPQRPVGDSGLPQRPGGEPGLPQRPGGDSGLPQRPVGDSGLPQRSGGDAGLPSRPAGDPGLPPWSPGSAEEGGDPRRYWPRREPARSLGEIYTEHAEPVIPAAWQPPPDLPLTSGPPLPTRQPQTTRPEGEGQPAFRPGGTLPQRPGAAPRSGDPLPSRPGPGEPLPSRPGPGEPLASRPGVGEPLPSRPLPGEPLPSRPLSGEILPPRPGGGDSGSYRSRSAAEPTAYRSGDPLPSRPAQSDPGPGDPLPSRPVPGEPAPAPAPYRSAFSEPATYQPEPGSYQPEPAADPLPARPVPGEPAAYADPGAVAPSEATQPIRSGWTGTADVRPGRPGLAARSGGEALPAEDRDGGQSWSPAPAAEPAGHDPSAPLPFDRPVFDRPGFSRLDIESPEADEPPATAFGDVSAGARSAGFGRAGDLDEHPFFADAPEAGSRSLFEPVTRTEPHPEPTTHPEPRQEGLSGPERPEGTGHPEPAAGAERHGEAAGASSAEPTAAGTSEPATSWAESAWANSQPAEQSFSAWGSDPQPEPESAFPTDRAEVRPTPAEPQGAFLTDRAGVQPTPAEPQSAFLTDRAEVRPTPAEPPRGFFGDSPVREDEQRPFFEDEPEPRPFNAFGESHPDDPPIRDPYAALAELRSEPDDELPQTSFASGVQTLAEHPPTIEAEPQPRPESAWAEPSPPSATAWNEAGPGPESTWTDTRPAQGAPDPAPENTGSFFLTSADRDAESAAAAEPSPGLRSFFEDGEAERPDFAQAAVQDLPRRDDDPRAVAGDPPAAGWVAAEDQSPPSDAEAPTAGGAAGEDRPARSGAEQSSEAGPAGEFRPSLEDSLPSAGPGYQAGGDGTQDAGFSWAYRGEPVVEPEIVDDAPVRLHDEIVDAEVVAPPAGEPAPAVEEPPAEPARSPKPSVSPADFRPANTVEKDLFDAVQANSTDRFLSTLLLAKVIIPFWTGDGPVEPAKWRTEHMNGLPHLVVFTSQERMSERLGEDARGSWIKFARLIRHWPPGDQLAFAINPESPSGAVLPGAEVIQLASWAAEMGLGVDDPEEQPAAEAPKPEPQPEKRPAYEPPGSGLEQVMQKPISPEQLSHYLERNYDRVSGFVHRAGEVAHLETPEQLYNALGLGYAGSSFKPDADEAYVLRWIAYRGDLYRIPYGGSSHEAMRAMEGWVIERPPFRGNGFAPSETSDVIAEFKVDSARLPHNAELWRLRRDGRQDLIARLDADGPAWRKPTP